MSTPSSGFLTDLLHSLLQERSDYIKTTVATTCLIQSEKQLIELYQQLPYTGLFLAATFTPKVTWQVHDFLDKAYWESFAALEDLPDPDNLISQLQKVGFSELVLDCMSLPLEYQNLSNYFLDVLDFYQLTEEELKLPHLGPKIVELEVVFIHGVKAPKKITPQKKTISLENFKTMVQTKTT